MFDAAFFFPGLWKKSCETSPPAFESPTSRPNSFQHMQPMFVDGLTPSRLEFGTGKKNMSDWKMCGSKKTLENTNRFLGGGGGGGGVSDLFFWKGVVNHGKVSWAKKSQMKVDLRPPWSPWCFWISWPVWRITVRKGRKKTMGGFGQSHPF